MGSKPGAGGGNGGGAGGEALDRPGKAGSGGGGATDVRQGGKNLDTGSSSAPEDAGGAGGGIGGPIGTGGGNGGDLIGHEGFAVLGTGEPSDRRRRRDARAAGGDPGRNASDLLVTATAGVLGSGGDGGRR